VITPQFHLGIVSNEACFGVASASRNL